MEEVTMGAAAKNRAKDREEPAKGGFSDQERGAIKERAAELKADTRRRSRADKAAVDREDVLAKIAEMPPEDRELAERIHAVVTAAAPNLAPKLYYGQPAYASNGKVVCFFRSGQMDKERYSTFGFSQEASLDNADGIWPTSYALTRVSSAGEEAIAALVKKAVGCPAPMR